MEFKSFLIESKRNYLADKVSQILSDAQELTSAGKQLGARNLIDYSTELVGKIRTLIHSSFPRSDRKFLISLQKVGVAIMKSIDEKGDLNQTLVDAIAELEKIQEKL
jgi:hypothetical protein